MKLREFVEGFKNLTIQEQIKKTSEDLGKTYDNLAEAMKANNWSKVEEIMKKLKLIKKDLEVFIVSSEVKEEE